MRHVLVVIGIGVVVAAFAATLSNEFYLRVLFSISTYYLCAAGMNVLLGYAGQKSLGQAGLFAAGAYSVAVLTTQYGVNPWWALLIAAFISAFFGVLIALPSLRVRGPSLAMVTLAFGLVVEKVVSEFTEPFGGATGIYDIQPLTWFGRPLTMLQWVILGIALCVVVHLLLRNLLTGRFGRAFLSLQADELAASSVGVQVYQYKVLAFVIAAVTCGVAGALVAQQNQYFNSDFISFNLSIFILLLVLFGGSGSLYGPIVGAVFLVVLGAVLARWTWLEQFVNGSLLLFALFVMPKGLAGVLAGVRDRVFPRPLDQSLATASASLSLRTAADTIAKGDALLVAKGISKSYGGVIPARDVNLTVTAGSIHALIGPNGAGKTTLINILSGVVRPTVGSVVLGGVPLNGISVDAICDRGLARTFQNLRLFKDLSVLDNVLLGQHRRIRSGFIASLFALPKSHSEEALALARVKSILSFVGLSAHLDTPAGGLAYGLQRRVELARALATEPIVLLLDEPAAGLNPSETAELGDLLLRIRDHGVTILLVEHHMDMVMRISDHVSVLNYGETIAEGAPPVVQMDSQVIAAYLGPNEDSW